MKKIILITTLVLIMSVSASATDIIFLFKTDHFFPAENAFKDIYDSGIMIGGEASIRLWRKLDIWLGGRYFSKQGELTFTREETTIKIIPIGGGLKYRFSTEKKIIPYFGLGINYYSYKESNPIGDVNKGGVGYIATIGLYWKLMKGFLIDLYSDYTYCKIKPADYRINVGGISIGIGFGYKF